MQQVFDSIGQPKNIDELVGKPGGEGSVYRLVNEPGFVVKVYHPEKLAHNRGAYQEKIEAMIAMEKQFTDIDVCWPLLSVYDESRQWQGYAMKEVSGAIPMGYLAHGALWRKYFPDLNRIILCQFLLSLIKNVEALHSKDVYIGDYNLCNFLCTRGTNKVTMIDCDSYQISVGGRIFPCPVGSPDLTPIEHHNKDFAKVERTIDSERFSLAIVLFECLMLGRHPYDVVGGEDRVTNMKKGYFPYGKGKGGIPHGPWYNIWSHLPYKIKGLFIQTFTDGIKLPGKRISLDIWREKINGYLWGLQQEWYNQDIIPDEPKSTEYNGKKKIEGT